MTELLYQHAMSINAIPHEQRALVRKQRGCTDAVHIDATVTERAKANKGSLSVAWVDYAMAYMIESYTNR